MAGSSSCPVFQWGKKQAGTDSSYESMCYKGVWYGLYDCVFCRSGMKKPYVGKLMRLYEDEGGARKVRIRWFLRPYELPVSVIRDLPKHVDNTNELFIALGSAKGVENDNKVEVILGTAFALCTARYRDNLVPPRLHVDGAHHFFNRAYDVSKKKVVKLANIENKALGKSQTLCTFEEFYSVEIFYNWILINFVIIVVRVFF